MSTRFLPAARRVGTVHLRVNAPGARPTTLLKSRAKCAWWWTFGPGWPEGGEHDIAEGCGTLGANYHSPSVNGGDPIPGVWSNQFHIYGLHRKADSADVYYDGKLVRTHPTADDGSPQVLEVNVGNGCGGTPLSGPTANVLVDYVRAWE